MFKPSYFLDLRYSKSAIMEHLKSNAGEKFSKNKLSKPVYRRVGHTSKLTLALKQLRSEGKVNHTRNEQGTLVHWVNP